MNCNGEKCLKKRFEENADGLSPISQFVDDAVFRVGSILGVVIGVDEILDGGICVLNAFVEIAARQLWHFCIWMPLIAKDG